LLDPTTGSETRLTDFSGDVQLTGLRWSPPGERLAFARFRPDGTRDLVVLDLETGEIEAVASGADNRVPVWSPDGQRLAFTSLRDDAPNVFVLDLAPLASSPITAFNGEEAVPLKIEGDSSAPP